MTHDTDDDHNIPGTPGNTTMMTESLSFDAFEDQVDNRDSDVEGNNDIALDVAPGSPAVNTEWEFEVDEWN